MGGIFTKPKDDSPGPQSTDTAAQNTVLHRDLSNVPPSAMSTSSQNNIALSLGWNVWDSSGGAAVSCFGHAFQPRIWAAVARSMDYAATTTFTAEVVGQLCEKLVNTTNGTMARAVIYNSGEFSKVQFCILGTNHSRHRCQ
jgi:adenosylmethionine-8-amino-7-oxononanoate aminotransferase